MTPETLPVPQPSVQAQTVAADANSLIAVVDRALHDPAINVEKMERVLGIYERLTARENEANFNAAMATVQSAMTPVSTDAANPQTHSRYASYAALDRALRPIYTSHGFALSFDTAESPENIVRLLCYVSHNGGHTRTYRVDMPADGKGAKGGDVMTKTHAAGSAFTYGARYLLKMIFNVAVGEADDDGNAAGGAKLITDEQVEKLRQRIMQVDVDLPGFLKFLNVDRLESILSISVPRAMAAIDAKEKMAAKDTPNART